jgi:hypothetical protein
LHFSGAGEKHTIKSLIALKPFVNGPKEKRPKHCSTCGSLATMEAHFDVGDRVTMIEKYCDACSKKIAYRM